MLRFKKSRCVRPTGVVTGVATSHVTYLCLPLLELLLNMQLNFVSLFLCMLRFKFPVLQMLRFQSPVPRFLCAFFRHTDTVYKCSVSNFLHAVLRALSSYLWGMDLHFCFTMLYDNLSSTSSPIKHVLSSFWWGRVNLVQPMFFL